jgi:UDP-N-acetylmuramoylalanine--D-glutamate ligase
MANVAVVGYGEQGRSAFEYWFDKGDVVIICDQNPDIKLPPAAIDKLGANYLENLNEFDIIVRSPSVHPKTILEANLETPEIKDKITTNTNEFFKVCPSKNIIGVTGTKGKGTTSTLIAKILEADGKKVHLGGNIGIPPLDLLKNTIRADDWVVLELANFQLIDLKYSPHIAVCLMVTDEHLDWHEDMYEYIKAKQQIFIHQKLSDIAVYNADNVYTNEIITVSVAHNKISYSVPKINEQPEYTDGAYVEGDHIIMRGHKIANVHDVALLGRHNLENICAAIGATWDITKQNVKAVTKVIKSFKGLPHRLEEIGKYKDITFVDDSFGTNPSTAIVAIEAYQNPKVLILGGSNKNIPFDDLVNAVAKSNIRHIVAIGEMGPVIVGNLQQNKTTAQIPYTLIDTSKTMKDIVNTALGKAQKGDVILLSTACASFDMFKNYKDRGEQFKQVFKSLN